MWEGLDPVYRFNHTSWMAFATPTDCPKSVCDCCVIEVFGRVFLCCHVAFWIFCGCTGFCHESDLFLYLLSLNMRNVPINLIIWKKHFMRKCFLCKQINQQDYHLRELPFCCMWSMTKWKPFFMFSYIDGSIYKILIKR